MKGKKVTLIVKYDEGVINSMIIKIKKLSLIRVMLHLKRNK